MKKWNLKIFKKMCKLDPDLMSKIMAKNSMCLEIKIPKNIKLQKEWKRLYKLAILQP